MKPKRKRAKPYVQTPMQILLGIHLRELWPTDVFEIELMLGGPRAFRFDIANLTKLILFECDGGARSGGHMRGDKIEEQYEKDRLAQLLGWKVFRFTNRQINTGEAKEWCKENAWQTTKT